MGREAVLCFLLVLLTLTGLSVQAQETTVYNAAANEASTEVNTADNPTTEEDPLPEEPGKPKLPRPHIDSGPPEPPPDYYNPGDEVEGEALALEVEFTGGHSHRHPPNKEHDMYKTIMRISYDENDPLGPKHWTTIPGAYLTTNECGSNLYSPVNIIPKECTVRDPDMDQLIIEIEKPSLNFDVHKNVEQNLWYFGHPTDTYFGIEIKAGAFGMFQLMDDFDSHLTRDGTTTSKKFDFIHASIMYCDHSKAPNRRSSHQIKGKKYPFEINMAFYAVSPSFGVDTLTFGPDRNDLVMVTVLGEISKQDNPSLEPLVSAARKFSGPSYKEDWSNIRIKNPFSPSWLLPRNSSYFYYAGTFPVPPCYTIPRIYVMEKRIPISKTQLKAFTSIKTKREASGKLPCTQGYVRKTFRPEEILYNGFPIKIVENDKRPKGRAVDPDAPDSNSNVITGFTPWMFLSVLAILIQ